MNLDPAVPEVLEQKLATPLSSLHMPTRLANILHRRGIETIADLVRLSPEELLAEKNLGRKSVFDARMLIQQTLGGDWEKMRVEALGILPGVEGRPDDGEILDPSVRWDRFSDRLSPLASTPLDRLDFPARLVTFAKERKLTTLGELLAVSWDGFSTAKNVGRGTVTATLGVLDAVAERLSASSNLPGEAPSMMPSIPSEARWSFLLRRGLASLEGNERIIATQRAGLAGPIPTLAELGECFGVSRERIRQIESQAIARLRRSIACDEVLARLRAACVGLVTQAEVVAERDRLFMVEEDELPTLTFFVNDVLARDTVKAEPPVFALIVRERLVFSNVDRAALTALLDRTRALLSSASFPAEERELATTIASPLDLEAHDVEVLFGYLEEPLIKDGLRVVGFGRTREDEVLATLRAAPGPIERAALEALHGRGALPEQAIFVAHGLVSLAEKLDGWDRWERRLPPIARRLIEREGPERQWSTEELVDQLALECELPEWMNAWTLGSLLRRSFDLTYLGRNVVALPAPPGHGSDGSESKRIHVAPALEEILRSHGRPVLEDEARAELEKRRGLSTHTWNLMRVKRPFVLLEGGTIGLFPRDVPGGEARATQVLGALYESLRARQTGFNGPDTASFLTELGDIAGEYTPRVLRGVARLDARFRLSVSGAIGLAEWDSVRVPTQREVIELLLRAGGGEVAIDHVRAQMVTSSGAWISRGQLASLAGSVGARFEGDAIVWRGTPVGNSYSELIMAVLADLPERAATLLERMIEAESRGGPSTLGLDEELSSWGAALRASAASDAPHIEIAQVDTIESDARRLLASIPTLTDDERMLALAAIRYVVCTEDADSDFLVGGLDDDEVVLSRVMASVPLP